MLRVVPDSCERVQVTRNESQLSVRQSTAVNPHVVPLVAAKVHLLPTTRQLLRQDDWSLTEDDLPRSGSSRRQHLKWCGHSVLCSSQANP